MEPLPIASNRVELLIERDPLGVRRARLTWQRSAAEREAHERCLQVFAARVGYAAVGRVQILAPELRGRIRPSSHHMGTTRMDENPQRGVVDAQCGVHGVPNLFIAGSSVFPSAGFANPTLTIIALTLRLADYLKTRLSSEFA